MLKIHFKTFLSCRGSIPVTGPGGSFAARPRYYTEQWGGGGARLEAAIQGESGNESVMGEVGLSGPVQLSYRIGQPIKCGDIGFSPCRLKSRPTLSPRQG